MEKIVIPSYKSVDLDKVEHNLNIAINKGAPINLKAYSLAENTEKTLDTIIKNILAHYGKEHLHYTLYTCVKELAINATKANIKRVFFQEKGFNMEDPIEYKQGMELFKKNFSELWFMKYGLKAKKRGYYVLIKLDHSPDVFWIRVINNSPLSAVDDKRIRDRLSKAMQYDDIAQFYMDAADDTEGAGMGIALIIMLLKGEGIDPHLYTIGSNGKETIAKIEVPLSENYVPQRKRREEL